jgi:hypothetical protein
MMAWGEAGLATLDGAVFFARGNTVAHGPSYYILKRMPWGLHTYGVILLILGAYIFYSSARCGFLARRVQFATFVVSIWISAAVVISWIQVNTVAFGSITKWFLVAWIALSLYLTEERRFVKAEEG